MVDWGAMHADLAADTVDWTIDRSTGERQSKLLDEIEQLTDSDTKHGSLSDEIKQEIIHEFPKPSKINEEMIFIIQKYIGAVEQLFETEEELRMCHRKILQLSSDLEKQKFINRVLVKKNHLDDESTCDLYKTHRIPSTNSRVDRFKQI